jgi:hypothetical protein
MLMRGLSHGGYCLIIHREDENVARRYSGGAPDDQLDDRFHETNHMRGAKAPGTADRIHEGGARLCPPYDERDMIRISETLY